MGPRVNFTLILYKHGPNWQKWRCVNTLDTKLSQVKEIDPEWLVRQILFWLALLDFNRRGPYCLLKLTPMSATVGSTRLLETTPNLFLRFWWRFFFLLKKS